MKTFSEIWEACTALKAAQKKAKSIPVKAPPLVDGDGKVVDEFRPVPVAMKEDDLGEMVTSRIKTDAIDKIFAKANANTKDAKHVTLKDLKLGVSKRIKKPATDS